MILIFMKKIMKIENKTLLLIGGGLLAYYLFREKKPKKTKEQAKLSMCNSKYDMAHTFAEQMLKGGTSERVMSEADKIYQSKWVENCSKTHIVERGLPTHKGNRGWTMRKIVS